MLTKHHEAIAKIIKERSGDKLENESKETAQYLAKDLADLFEQEESHLSSLHQNFDRKKFLDACGID